MSDVKSFFHQWCVKKGVDPTFDVRPTGPKHRQRFLCEVRVEGYTYVGAGNSTTKKDAMFNAAKDFVQYMVRQGIILANEVPKEVSESVGGVGGGAQIDDKSGILSSLSSKPVFQPGHGPNTMGQAYTPIQRGEGPAQTYIDVIADQKRVEEAEEVDVNASIHGNWTVENAKSKLHQYMQVHKINTDYKYTIVGPDHSRGFVAEMTVPCPKLGRAITGRETGSNKQTASKSCALSIIRQMFHLGVIEAFSGTLKKKSTEQIKPYEVNIDPELFTRITNILDQLKIMPPQIDDDSFAEDHSKNGSMISASSQTCKKCSVSSSCSFKMDSPEPPKVTYDFNELGNSIALNLCNLEPDQLQWAIDLIAVVISYAKSGYLTGSTRVRL